jgi:ribosomal protein L13E
MSAEAIDQRLRDLAQLYKLGMSLRDVKLLGKAVDLRRKAAEDGPRAAPAAKRSGP